MSQAERHARQQEFAAQAAAEMLRQRQALKPKAMAVYVRLALGGRREAMHSPLWLLVELGAVKHPHATQLFSGVVRK